jgi:hypothetical protein
MLKKNLTWNRPQTNLILNRHLIHTSKVVGGRGGGKSSLIADVVRYITVKMPRCTGTIQGATFQQLLTRTLPGTFEFLDTQGFVRDKDYWINRKPDVRADKLPYYKPLRWDNYITIKGPDGYCSGFTLLSQDSSSRGPSTDVIICDESLLLDYEKFVKEAKFTNRGHDQYYNHLRKTLHHSEWHFTSMPSGNSWLFEHSAEYEQKLKPMLAMQDEVIDMQYEWLQLTDRKSKLELWQEIIDLQQQISWFVGKKGEYYAEFNVFDNVENLGLRYIYDMYKDTPKELFMIEALNKRSSKTDNGFYPQLDRAKHCYTKFNNSYLENLDFDFSKIKNLDSRQDGDCDTTLPLHIGTDYGGAINWIVVSQKNYKTKTLNVIKEFFVKSPKILDHAIEEFCEYYRHHQNKSVYIYPDAEAFSNRANSTESYIDTTIRILKSRGWSVTLGHRMKYNKLQDNTYHLVNIMLSEMREDFWRIRFNSNNCRGLLISMEQAPAFDHRGKVKKDKTSEKKLKLNREDATDASDAFDQIVYYIFNSALSSTRNYISRTFFG